MNPLTDRALDNTIPQSAYAYFIDPRNLQNDPYAPDCFRVFVNSYVNAIRRHVPLPEGVSSTPSLNEPFIKLWQVGATQLHGIVPKTSLERGDDDELLESFLSSVHERTDQWAGFLRAQWSGDIPDAYMARRANWKDDLRAGVHALGPAFHATSLQATLQSAVVLNAVAEQLARLPRLPAAFVAAAQGLGVPPALLALSFGFTSFARARAYREQLAGVDSKFHFLREGALVRPSEAETLADQGWELNWAPYLAAYLDNDIAPRDSELFAETLRGLNAVVHTDKGFEDRLLTYRETIGRPGEAHARRLLVAYALTSRRLPPQIRNRSDGEAIIEAVATSTSAAGAAFLRPLARVVVAMAMGSSIVQGTVFRIVEKWRGEGVWRTFVLPGADRAV